MQSCFYRTVLQNLSTKALRNSSVYVGGLADCYGLQNKVFFLEVDLHYPSQLHNLHDDYPLTAVSTVLNHEDLSPLQREQHDSQSGILFHCTVLY